MVDVDEMAAIDAIMADASGKQDLLHEDNIDYYWPSSPGSDSDPPDPPIRQLDDIPEARVIDWHPTAGTVIPSGLEQNVYERWDRLFGAKTDMADSGYKPFSSRLDWEIAQWAVKEKIGHGSLNRLLAIPEVRVISVFPFHLAKKTSVKRSTGTLLQGHAYHVRHNRRTPRTLWNLENQTVYFQRSA